MSAMFQNNSLLHLHSSGTSHNVDRQSAADVSRQPIGPTVEFQAV